MELAGLHVRYGIDEAMESGMPYGKPLDGISWVVAIWAQLFVAIVLGIFSLFWIRRKMKQLREEGSDCKRYVITSTVVCGNGKSERNCFMVMFVPKCLQI